MIPRLPIEWKSRVRPPELRVPTLRILLRRFLGTLGLPASELTLLLTDDPGIQALNRDHRGLDRPTDILSWSYLPPEVVLDPSQAAPEGVLHLGELALSVETTARQARENGWDLFTEAARLLAHGCAHLAGLDHQTPAQERRMLALEVRLLAAAGLHGLYPAAMPATRRKSPARKTPRESLARKITARKSTTPKPPGRTPATRRGKRR